MSSSDFPQRLPVSSHLKSPSPARSAKRTSFPTLKEHSLRSTARSERLSRSIKLTRRSSSSGNVTNPVKTSSGFPFVSTVTLSKVLDFFHVQNLSNASLEEAMVLHALYYSLVTQVKMLAAILPSSLQRPLQTLLGAMNESGRSYSKQSAAYKRP